MQLERGEAEGEVSVPEIGEFDLNLGSFSVSLSCLYTVYFNDILNERCIHFNLSTNSHTFNERNRT